MLFDIVVVAGIYFVCVILSAALLTVTSKYTPRTRALL